MGRGGERKEELSGREAELVGGEVSGETRCMSVCLDASPLAPLTPPTPHSLTNLYRADTVGERSDVIQLKVLPSLIKFCRKSMDIEVRIKAARVLGECVCHTPRPTPISPAPPPSLLPHHHFSLPDRGLRPLRGEDCRVRTHHCHTSQ